MQFVNRSGGLKCSELLDPHRPVPGCQTQGEGRERASPRGVAIWWEDGNPAVDSGCLEKCPALGGLSLRVMVAPSDCGERKHQPQIVSDLVSTSTQVRPALAGHADFRFRSRIFPALLGKSLLPHRRLGLVLL